MHIRDFRVPAIDTLFTFLVRNCPGESCNGRRSRGVESVDKHLETNSVHLQPQNKRRKVQAPLCVNSEYVDKIKGWLGDDEITTIGIHGMGGIGKTTIATQLHTNHDIPSNHHIHATAWISVGMDFTVYQLQQKIVDAFGLDLQSDKDVTRRAGMIYAFLSLKDKCIIFLDDLWGNFRRDDVGIPRKCKLIIISRLLDVCRILHCQKVIKVEPLSEEESWKLFQNSIGEYGVLDSKQVSAVRKLVYNECAGLPLAIIALAYSMRRTINASRWRGFLENADPFYMGPTQLEDILSQLKLSYDRLSNSKLQRCFLYSALYPKGYPISKEELIRLWIGVGLIDDVPSLQAQYDMGHSILNKLLNSCLLETCPDRSIKLHDLVRCMALSVAREGFVVKAGVPSKLEFYGNPHVISMIKSSISLIPLGTSLECSNLSTLLLQHNPLEVIPESFFLHMPALRVLSLSDTRIIRLPSSISALEELRVLDLSSCQKLKEVSPLAKLYELRFLDLSETAVEVPAVPCSLEILKGITELDLSSILKSKYFSRGVLPGLSKLKRLSCHILSIIHELQNLDSLKFLDAKFDSLLDLSSYVRSEHWRTLECFHLQVGLQIRPKRSYCRGVSLHGCILGGQGGEQIVLPDDIQELYLDDCSGFRSLSYILCPDNAYGLKQRAEVFTSLEICTISRCHDVEKLLSRGCLQKLQCLELLQVEECPQLKELIVEEVENDCYHDEKYTVLDFPQIKQLVLTSLPQLNNSRKGCAALRSLTVMDCPNLKCPPLSYMDGV